MGWSGLQSHPERSPRRTKDKTSRGSKTTFELKLVLSLVEVLNANTIVVRGDTNQFREISQQCRINDVMKSLLYFHSCPSFVSSFKY